VYVHKNLYGVDRYVTWASKTKAIAKIMCYRTNQRQRRQKRCLFRGSVRYVAQKEAPPTGVGGAVEILHGESGLMLETPLPGIDHCGADLIAGFDGLVVVLRSAGMNDRCNPFFQSDIDPVSERKKGIADHDRAD